MKAKFDITSIGACVTAILTLVALILFVLAYNGCYGYFEMQYPSIGYVITFAIIAIVLAIAIILLPMIKAEGKLEMIIGWVRAALSILVCVFLGLMVVYIAKCSVYEIALTFGSELHINEPYMVDVCNQAIASIVLAIVGMVQLGIGSAITVTVYEKKPA